MTDIILSVPKEFIDSTGKIDIEIKAHVIKSVKSESEEINTKSRLMFKLCSLDVRNAL